MTKYKYANKDGIVEEHFFADNGNCLEKTWTFNGWFHRVDGPAQITYFNSNNDFGRVHEENWFLKHKRHRPFGKPARTLYHENGVIRSYQWWRFGELHRTSGPACIWYYEDGEVECEEWWIDNKKHRVGSPAFILYYPGGCIQTEEWRIKGKLHRVGGPARVSFKNDGSIVEEGWWIHNKSHRLTGPAHTIWERGVKTPIHAKWHINGREIPMEEIENVLQGEDPKSSDGKMLLKLNYGDNCLI